MSINNNREIIESIINGQINKIHTALAAKITGYNASTNRATVKPIGSYKTSDYRSIEYPTIFNVPVIFPTGLGGSAGVTFPLSAGDGCLLVFSETQLDDMLSNVDSDDNRKFDLNDAICIPGFYSNAVPSNVSHANEVCMFNNGSLVRLGSSMTGELADGTNFSFSGGDLKVNGISLVGHVHDGVESGGSTTGKPQ